jgi:hypothetical protein
MAIECAAFVEGYQNNKTFNCGEKKGGHYNDWKFKLLSIVLWLALILLVKKN